MDMHSEIKQGNKPDNKPDHNPGKMPDNKPNHNPGKMPEGVFVRAVVDTDEQFEAAAAAEGVREILFESGSFRDGQAAERVRRAKEAGKTAGLAMPGIFTAKAEEYFEAHIGQICEAGFDSLLVRSFEELLFFAGKLRAGFRIPEHFVLDHGIYLFNRETYRMTKELLEDAFEGVKSPSFLRTFPQELNKRELQVLAAGLPEPAELVVYGRTPVMVSAQCINKTASGCSGKDGVLYLKDRTGVFMPVKRNCAFCLNTVYNSVPTVLLDLEEELKELKPASLRYEFTDESGRETAAILAGRMPAAGTFTRGHFHRGVQ